MGAALLGKATAPKSQSLILFGFCQVAIDLEPAVKMLLGYQGSLHSITHNPVGIFITTALCGALWDVLQERSWWRKDLPRLPKSTIFHTVWWAALSHLLLDSMSHADIPTSVSQWFGTEFTEDFCIGLGMVGLAFLVLRWGIKKTTDAVQDRQTKDRQS